MMSNRLKMRLWKRITSYVLIPISLVGITLGVDYYFYILGRKKGDIARQNPKYFDIDPHFHPPLVWGDREWNIEKTVDFMFDIGLEATVVLGYSNEFLNRELWPLLLEKVGEYREQPDRIYDVKIGNRLIEFIKREKKKLTIEDKRYILRGQEVRTKEGFDLLVLFPSGSVKPFQDFDKTMEEIKKVYALGVLNTAFLSNKSQMSCISGKEKEDLEKILQDKKLGPDALDYDSMVKPQRLLSYAKQSLSYVTGGSLDLAWGCDVNRKSIEAGEKYGKPIVPGTDIHAFNDSEVKNIATAYMAILRDKIDYNNGETIISSIKRSIRNGEFIRFEGEISLGHIVFKYIPRHILARVYPDYIFGKND